MQKTEKQLHRLSLNFQNMCLHQDAYSHQKYA